LSDELEIGLPELGSKSQTWLDITERLTKVVAIVAIPVVIPIALAIYSARVQGAAQTETINRDYVQLAVSVLTSKDRSVDPGLRDWAVDLLAEHSPTKFNDSVISSLKSGAVSLPSPANVRTPETKSPDKSLLARADSLGIQIIDAHSMQRRFMLQPRSDVVSLCFSDSNKLLAIGYDDQTIAIVSVITGKIVKQIPVGTPFVDAVFGASDKGVEVLTNAGILHFNAETGAKIPDFSQFDEPK
jgi:WD40 repeat protein